MKRALRIILAIFFLSFFTPIYAEDLVTAQEGLEEKEVLEEVQEELEIEDEDSYEEKDNALLEQLEEAKHALSKELETSKYLLDEAFFQAIDEVEDLQSLERLRTNAVQKQSDFEKQKEISSEAIERAFKKVQEELRHSTWLNPSDLQESGDVLIEGIQKNMAEANSFESLEAQYQDSLEAIEDWKLQQLSQADQKLHTAKNEHMASLKEAILEVQNLYQFFNLNSPELEENLQSLQEEAETLFLEAKDEAAMVDLESSLLEELDILKESILVEDLIEALEEVLDDESLVLFETLFDWGVLNQDEIESVLREILDNYEYYVDLGLTLKDVFEMQMKNLEAMKAFYERNQFLPATGLATKTSLYGFWLFLLGAVLLKQSH